MTFFLLSGALFSLNHTVKHIKLSLHFPVFSLFGKKFNMLICFLICASITLARALDCPGTAFDPPADTTKLTWYPNDFTNSAPPLFPNNFNCIYKINVPKGWSANIKLTMSMTIPPDNAVSVRVTDQNQFSEAVYSATNESFYFAAGQGNIQLNSREQNVRFGFSVGWYKIPTTFNPYYGSVTTATSQPSVWWAYSGSPIQIKAETRVSLVVTPPKDDEQLQYLRGMMIYDGPSWDAPCLGNALQVIKLQRQLVSSGQYMTFNQLSPSYPTGRAMLIFQDYQLSKDIVQYQGISFASSQDVGPISMNGVLGPSAITTVASSQTSGAEYLTSLSGSGNLDVYIGSKTSTKANLITSYNLNNTASYLPQEFLGYVRTYVFTGTDASLNFTHLSDQFSRNTFIGRKGFFASRYYKSGTPSLYQDVYDYIRAPTNSYFTYSFNLRAADFVGNTTLRIVVTNGAKTTYDQTFTSTRVPTFNSEVQALGDDLSVTYKTYGYSTTGMNILFVISLFVSHLLAYPDESSRINCNGSVNWDGISDTYPVTTYYPNYWNESSDAPFYQANQNCTWNILIPSQKYILFTMMADVDEDSSLVITDCNKKTETVMTSDLQPYVFVGTFFTIDLTVGSGNSTSFGFKIQWIDYPSTNSSYYTVSKNSSSLIYDGILFGNAETITAETQVSIVAFPSIWPDCTPLLRLSLVFDGPDINSTYLGTLYQSLRSGKPIISSGNQLTVYSFQEDYFVGPIYIAQDYYNIQNLTEIRGITCMSNASCPVTMNAANGPVSAMTLNIGDGDEYIKRLDMSQGALLKVYIGTKKIDTEDNMIASYNVNQSKTNIPQKFNGNILTYYLEQGTALVELAEDSNYTRWNDACDGRDGFISSINYGFPTTIQNTTEYIGGLYPDQMFAFNLNVSFVDISSGSNLNISFQSETGKKEYIFSSENPLQNRIISDIGSTMTVDYVTNGTASSTGFYLTFKISSFQTTSSAYVNTLMVFVLVLISLL
ncbi:unnamed protein product [Caenorhabditis brenneri]